MVGINIGISVCLAVLVVIAGVAVFGFVKAGSRKGRCDYVKNFKRGKCIVVYIAVMPLFIIGLNYEGLNFGECLFGAISESVNLVFLKCNLEAVPTLAADSVLYTATMYVAFVMVLINAILFTASLLQHMFWHLFKMFAWEHSERDRLIIFGDTDSSRITYKSAKGHKGRIIVGSKFDRDEKYKLYSEGYLYSETAHMLKYIQKRLDKKADSDKKFVKNTVVVINTGNELENIKLCRELTNIIKYVGYEVNKQKKKKQIPIAELKKRVDDLPKLLKGDTDEIKEKNKIIQAEIDAMKTHIVELFSHLCVYVFGDAANEALYRNIESASFGCIHYVNKYNRAAVDFIYEFPIARFMDERTVDYSTALVRPDVDINVTMIGFGDTLQQVFSASVANNQFLTAGSDGKPVLKPVHYYIFDREHAQNNKNLNHSYYRYRNEFFKLYKDEAGNDKPVIAGGRYVRPDGFDESKYLELPELPSIDDYFFLDINAPEFYINLKNIFVPRADDGKDKKKAGEAVRSKPRKAVNYVIIAYGSDLENIDLAQKILDKKSEWGIDDLFVFVKVNTADNVTDIFAREQEDCFRIADNKMTFDISRIHNGALIKMATGRNHLYAVERLMCDENNKELDAEGLKALIPAEIRNDDYDWYITKQPSERNSNIYASLSLRSKLLLMGLDYVPIGEKIKTAELSNDEYLSRYAIGDMPEYVPDVTAVYPEPEFKNKSVVKYDINGFKPSLRTTMAIHEHYRWNSYMISVGFIPADKETIVNETGNGGKKGKNYALRRHGNLTTFDGLVEFRKIVADKLCQIDPTRDRADVDNQADVIKYDYQLLDDAYWILKHGGYKIIERSSKSVK